MTGLVTASSVPLSTKLMSEYRNCGYLSIAANHPSFDDQLDRRLAVQPNGPANRQFHQRTPAEGLITRECNSFAAQVEHVASSRTGEPTLSYHG